MKKTVSVAAIVLLTMTGIAMAQGIENQGAAGSEGKGSLVASDGAKVTSSGGLSSGVGIVESYPQSEGNWEVAAPTGAVFGSGNNNGGGTNRN